jgi:hypothetical protein
MEYIEPYIHWYYRWPTLHSWAQAILNSKDLSNSVEMGKPSTSDINGSTSVADAQTQLQLTLNKVIIGELDMGPIAYYDETTCTQSQDRLKNQFGTDILAPLLNCFSHSYPDDLYSAKVSNTKDFLIGWKDLAKALKLNPQISFYLSGSTFDYVTSFQEMKAEADFLGPLSKFIPLQNSGHEGWATEPELFRLMISRH